MGKKMVIVTGFILCLGSLAFAGEKQAQKLSNETVQALESKGIKVHRLHKSVRPPVRGEEQKSDASQIIEIEVSLDLRKSGIKPVYLGTPMRAKTGGLAPYDTILLEEFEGEFPGSAWQLSGNPTWGKTSVRKRSGASSVWCAAGGDSAKTPGGAYPNNLHAMMVYGPFDLSDVNYGELKFYHWLDTEREKDWFYYMLSTDGTHFTGVGISGQTGFYSGTWKEERVPLSNFPDLGDVTGKTQVWLAFLFESDGHTTSDKGVYLDNITLTKRTISGTPIAGTISGTLGPEKNPYIAPMIAGVVEGDSLEIKPGVEIRFENEAEFVVLGYLKAVGTPSDSILFTSNTQPGSSGQWNGVSFASTTQEGSAVQFARIEYSDDGIFSDSPKVLIKNNLLTSNKNGVYCASQVTIIENTLVDNGKGIFAYFASPIVRKNLIQNNGTGISITFSTSTVIEGNQIIENKGTGISYFTAKPKIVNNVIKDNEGDGISGAIGEIGVSGLLVITGNQIMDNSKVGIHLSTLAISGFVTQNIIKGNSDGIQISPGYGANPSMRIINNSIVNNRGYGMNFGKGNLQSSDILNNIVFGNGAAGIYSTGENSEIHISFNNVFGNTPDYAVGANATLGTPALINARGDSSDVYFNISRKPRFVDAAGGDYHLQYVENGFASDSPCRDTGSPHVFYNDPDGTTNDMGAYGGTGLFIQRTSHDFGKLVFGIKRETSILLGNLRESTMTVTTLELSDPIHFSLSTSAPFDIEPYGTASIKIAFNPINTGDHNATLKIYSNDFVGATSADITLHGRAINGTIVNTRSVNGTWTKEKSPYLVTRSVEIPKNSSLTINPGVHVWFETGLFRIRGRLHAVGTKEDSIKFTRAYNAARWSGLYFDSADPASTVEYCIIEYSDQEGIDLYKSDIQIRHNTIQNNQGDYDAFVLWGAGGIQCDKSSPVIEKNVIRDNFTTKEGGGILAVRGASPVIRNNLISGNKSLRRGGGIALKDSALLVNNTITDNHATTGGGVYISSSKKPRLWNNIIARNQAQSGGGIYGKCDVSNSTIYGNIAESRGGGTYLKTGSTVTNSIVYGNVASQGEGVYISYGKMQVRYSDIQDGYQGEGNIDVNPLFVDAEHGDFRLQASSPCIDAGDPAPEYNDPEDPNNPGFALAPAKGTVRNDMGAFGGPGAAGALVNYPPSPFHLLTPTTNDTVTSDTLCFRWQRAHDPNPADAVRYTLQFDTTRAFSQPVTFTGLADTAYVLANSLVNETRYFWTVSAFDNAGLSAASPDTFSFIVHRVATAVENTPTGSVPLEFTMSQNYPNPFNPETAIRYQLPKAIDVKLEIYNLLGQRVATLVEKNQPPGYYSVTWDGKDDFGHRLASGVYLYRLQAGDFVKIRKLTLLR